jgi:hypothetical protein
MWSLLRLFSAPKTDLWDRAYLGMDFGPYYGVDYARFSDEPDARADEILRERIEDRLRDDLGFGPDRVRIFVRNGFVFLTLAEGVEVDRDALRSRTKACGPVITVEIFCVQSNSLP